MNDENHQDVIPTTDSSDIRALKAMLAEFSEHEATQRPINVAKMVAGLKVLAEAYLKKPQE